MVVQKLFQAFQYLVMRLFPGQELAVVKALRVVEKGLELRDNDIFTELVDIGLAFLQDIPSSQSY